MTPRVLLTTLGAAAIAFSVIIGAAANSSQPAAQTVQSHLAAAPTGTILGQRPAAWNDDCVIAV